MEEILQKEYGLNPDKKIVVFWTKEVSLPHFNRYRVKFRKVFSGKVKELKEWVKNYKIRKRKIKFNMINTKYKGNLMSI